MVRVAVCAALLCGGLGACSLFTSLSDLSSGGVPTDDASSSSNDAGDGALPAGEEDAGDDAGDGGLPPNLHGYGTFDDDCEGWGGLESTATWRREGRTGIGACEFCAETPGYFSVDDLGFYEHPEPGVYRVVVWLKNASEQPATKSLKLFMRTFIRDPFANVEIAGPSAVVPTNEWKQVEVTLVVTQPADSLNVFLSEDFGTAGRCFLLDDVRVERLR